MREKDKTPKSAKAWHWILALFARLMFWRDLPELGLAGFRAPAAGEAQQKWHVVAWRSDPETGRPVVLRSTTSDTDAAFELDVLDLATRHRGCRLTVMTPEGGGRLTARARRAVLARARRQLVPRGVGRLRRRLGREQVLRVGA